MILEGLVTTLPRADAPKETANIAPMGPIVDDTMSRLILRPFTSSTTYRNLKAHGEGVFHVTDDALLIARAAIGTVRPCADAPVRLAEVVRGVILSGACRYYEFRVRELDDSHERTRITAEVVHRGTQREFFGFNRAKHAVLEAAILATRLHLTGAEPVLAEFERLRVIVDKTGGEAEHTALRELTDHVRSFAAQADGRPGA